MADAHAPKILSCKIIEEAGQMFIVSEFGTESIRREIPKGHILVRFSAILDEKRQLSDIEIITQKE